MTDMTIDQVKAFPAGKGAKKTNKAPAQAAQSHFVAHFAFEKETKGAVRYMQVTAPGSTTPYSIGDGAEIGSLYVRKSAFGDKFPQTLVVTVS